VAEPAAVLEKERVCCPLLTFRLIAEKDEGSITLEVSGPLGSAARLRKLQTGAGGEVLGNLHGVSPSCIMGSSL